MDLILINNSKGGVGKSVVCRALFQYHLDHGHPFIGYDTDRSNPDVYRCYGQVIPVKLAILSEASKFEDHANGIFNDAQTHRVIVNLPAQVHQPLRDWIMKNELLEIAPDAGVRFHFWFVCDSGYDSLQLLKATLDLYQDQVSHVIVRNFGRTDDFQALEEHEEIQQLAHAYRAKFIDFPMLTGSVIRNRIDTESLSFGAALTREDFGLIDKTRIRKFLREAYRNFETTEVFHHDR
jgi:hypothetical protein